MKHPNVLKGAGERAPAVLLHYLAASGKLMRCLKYTFKIKDLKCGPVFEEGSDLNKAQCGMIVAVGS